MNEYMKKRTGTSFKGYLMATYQDLVVIFGEPISNPDNYKVDTEWIIDTPHGVATIYNYKDGKVYLGDQGQPVQAICEWHVGGKGTEAYSWVKKEVLARKISSFA